MVEARQQFSEEEPRLVIVGLEQLRSHSQILRWTATYIP